jgi:hypothetical protein
MAIGRRSRAQKRNLRQREVIALERQAYAFARIATAMEKRNQMNEEMAQPLRVHVDGQARKAPTVLTTPAARTPTLEERATPGALDDDEIEPLSDKS